MKIKEVNFGCVRKRMIIYGKILWPIQVCCFLAPFYYYFLQKKNFKKMSEKIKQKVGNFFCFLFAPGLNFIERPIQRLLLCFSVSVSLCLSVSLSLCLSVFQYLSISVSLSFFNFCSFSLSQFSL